MAEAILLTQIEITPIILGESLLESVSLTVADAFLSYANFDSVDLSSGLVTSIALPIYKDDKAARRGGLRTEDLYWDYSGSVRRVNSRFTQFFLNLAKPFTLIGRL